MGLPYTVHPQRCSSPSTRRPIMAQGPAGAASSEQPKGDAIGPQLSRHALRKRRARGGRDDGECRPRRSSWPRQFPTGRCLACPMARALGLLPAVRIPVAVAVAVPQQHGLTSQPLSAVGQSRDVECWGWRRRRRWWWLWSYSTSTHPPTWRTPLAYLPLAPLPTAPVFTVSPDEKCRAAAGPAPSSNGRVQGTKCLGEMGHRAHDGPRPTGHKSQEQMIGL